MENDTFVQNDMLTVRKSTLLGPLPDPFLGRDGRRVSSRDQWPGRREGVRKDSCDLLFGPEPPRPEFVRVEALCDYRITRSTAYRVHTGTKERPLAMRLHVILPEKAEGPCPIIVDGDECFYRQPGYLDAALQRGIGWALFDRTEIAHDVQYEPRGTGPIYDTYPGLDCGAISAWAWGYSRCVDALEQLKLPIDRDWIAFTGHSRGGKTALLAGARDVRARIVNPNDSGAGGSGCYRLRVEAVYKDGTSGREERISDSLSQFPYWYSRDLEKFVDRETELPFDLHFIKALVAPRILFISEAAGDMWCNPVGSWQTTMAAREVYRFLGAEKNLFWYYRPGFHAHTALDAEMLAGVIWAQRRGDPVDERMFRLPFEEPSLCFDWRRPTP